MSEYNFVVTQECKNQRVDKLLTELIPNTSRSSVQKAIEKGKVTVNGKRVTKKYTVNNGDKITATIDDCSEIQILPENIPIDIVYEDEDLLVCNKPRGMVVHPAAGNYNGTLVNALLYKYGNNLSHINGDTRPGIIHRIDKDTSGLLIVAKNDKAHISLAGQIKEHSFTREYKAVVCGHLKSFTGTVNAPIGRNPADRKKMCVTYENSKEAVTHFQVLQEFEGYSYVKLVLETGRTHQIRVHMAHLGHSVAGDLIYGHDKKSNYLNGQCLHAYKIGFVHPTTSEYMEFSSPLPDYFKSFLRKISNGEYNEE